MNMLVNTPAGTRKPVIFVVSSIASMMPMVMLGRGTSAQGHAVHFLVDGGGPALIERLRPQAADMGATLHVFDELPAHEARVTERQRFWRHFKKLPGLNGFFKVHLELNARMLARSDRLLQETGAGMLVVPEDGISGNVWMLNAARRKHIPVLTCPYGHGTRRDFEDALIRKQEQNDLRTVKDKLGFIVKLLFPKWVKTGNMAGAMMLPPGIILVREALDLSLRDPWLVNGGAADALAVESVGMQAHYDAEGVPRKKCVLTGSVYADALAAAMGPAERAAFEHATRITPGRTKIVVSWPTSYHANRAHLCEFADYETLTRRFFGVLAAQPDVDVTVSLHPAAGPEARKIIADCGFTLSDDYIVDLIARNDVFVNCFSSTIRWAVAAAKPVVNYDFYSFRLPSYDACPGVLYVDTFAGYEQAVARVLKDFDEISALQKTVAADWGALDGGNFGRIYALMQKMMA